MNTGAGRYAWPASARDRDAARPTAGPAVIPRGRETAAARPDAAAWVWWLARRIRVRHVIVLAVAVAYPWLATPFLTFQVGAQSLALGLIALSLTFLAGYGGMISLAQVTVAGIAGYTYAIFGASGSDICLRWPWGLAVVLGLVSGSAGR